jgi:hypothetical protein
MAGMGVIFNGSIKTLSTHLRRAWLLLVSLLSGLFLTNNSTELSREYSLCSTTQTLVPPRRRGYAQGSPVCLLTLGVLSNRSIIADL